MQCFRCNHSGKYLPPDYVKEWGIKYGHGLGKEPVSECLDTDYGKLPDMDRAKYRASVTDYMYPLSDTRANITLVDVTEAEYNKPENRIILVRDDRNFAKRAALIRKIQKTHAEEWGRFKAHTAAV